MAGASKKQSFAALSLVVLALPLSYFCADPSTGRTVVWSIAQWMPVKSVRTSLQQFAWNNWESEQPRFSADEEIPTVDVQKHREVLSQYLEQTYGKDWRKRPLLFKGLWTSEELNDGSRQLSLEGLLKEELRVPYFTDSRLEGALTPDGQGAVRDIVANITRGEPHKIGSQLLVQSYPHLVQEVAPHEIVTSLFGNYFTPNHVEGSGPFNLFPAMTTVPVFIANGKRPEKTTKNAGTGNHSQTEERKPFTALHCEPIGNIAVQLSGQKKWTLVRPEFFRQLKPSVSPDGRAFFASWSSDYSDVVPTYTAITAAGDAMWVPTWTWHRVDYIESEDLAIGASLFHFRVLDFVANNPLFAVLIVPAIILELVGYNTQ
jgi:hypothetical protein